DGPDPLVGGLLALMTLVLVAGTTDSTLFAVRAAEKAEDAEESARKAGEAEVRAKGQAKAARQRAYDSDMLLTQAAWEQHQVRRFLELLTAQRPRRGDEEDLRGFEWYYWTHQFQRGHLTLKG